MAYDELLKRAEAISRMRDLRAAIDVSDEETVALDAIDGRILARDIVSSYDYPPRSIATMDGFAFDASEGFPLTVVGEVFPEDEPPTLLPGQAVRIATGAPLPTRSNAVLKREDATLEDELLTGETIEEGTYVYRQGSNITAGEVVLDTGQRLSARHAIVLADLGYEEVTVQRGLSVGILATGSEIHEGVSTDLDSPMLSGLIRRWGHRPSLCGTVPDDYETVRDRIAELAADHDVVVTTGGTSVGRKDHVIHALDDLGSIAFHGVRIRPGKPIGVAVIAEQDAIALAIPGKPVGAFTIAVAVCRAFFTGTNETSSIEATLTRSIAIPRHGFEYWIPVSLEPTEELPEAMPLGHTDSSLQVYTETFSPSVLSSSTKAVCADGIIITESDLVDGEQVSVVPFDEFS